MQQEKAFVTGGSGFLGRNLITELKKNGVEVNALARSEEAINTVKNLGANPVKGDVNSYEALLEGMQGCGTVFHLAAKVDIEGPMEEFVKINVEGTDTVLKAAKNAKVKNFVLCSTESVLIGGPPLINADEKWPYPTSPAGPYAATKGESERHVVAANDPENNFKTVVIRPRMIWGRGDTVLGPKVAEKHQKGEFLFMGDENNLTSTCHVRNVVEGLIKGAKNGKGGEIYFVTDGKPIKLREFFIKYLSFFGVDVSKCWSVPVFAAKIGSFFGMVPSAIIPLFGITCTVNDQKARNEIGYQGLVSMEDGFSELEADLKNKPEL